MSMYSALSLPTIVRQLVDSCEGGVVIASQNEMLAYNDKMK